AKQAAPKKESPQKKPAPSSKRGTDAKIADGKIDPKTAVTQAVDEIVAAEEAAREEATLQKEIAEELERESAQTSQLVKEDFSPLNSSREQLVLEYAPLIKYIAQKIAAR